VHHRQSDDERFLELGQGPVLVSDHFLVVLVLVVAAATNVRVGDNGLHEGAALAEMGVDCIAGNGTYVDVVKQVVDSGPAYVDCEWHENLVAVADTLELMD